MKIIQTNDQMEIKSSGFGQLALGIILALGGIGTAVVVLGGKKAPIWAALIGLGMVIIGILTALFAKNRKAILQLGGNVTVTDKRVIGGGVQQQSVPISSVVAVRLSTYLENTGNYNDGNRSTSRRSVLGLLLSDNDIIQLGSSGGGGFTVNGLNVSSMIMKAPLSKEANQIAAFLGVPLQADDSSSIAGAVQSLKSAFGQPTASEQPTAFNPNETPAPPQQTVQSMPQVAPAATAQQPSAAPQTPATPAAPPNPAPPYTPEPPQSPQQ